MTGTGQFRNVIRFRIANLDMNWKPKSRSAVVRGAGVFPGDCCRQLVCWIIAPAIKGVNTVIPACIRCGKSVIPDEIRDRHEGVRLFVARLVAEEIIEPEQGKGTQWNSNMMS
jgi:hypothetical protein